MQAVLSASAIKPFTRALAALSKYGEDLDIHATPECLSLSATNSSKSAYGRFKITPEFFEKYKVGTDAVRKEFDFGGGGFMEDDPDDVEEVESASGQILVKSILSILRHRGFEKSVKRCELAIVPGRAPGTTQQASGSTTSSNSSYQSILLFRLHCEHGVTKTHRLALSVLPDLLAPQIPESETPSRVVVGPRAIKDLIDHFAKTRGKGGGDLQLIWAWGESEVRVRTLRGLTQGHTDSQIATSILVEAEEFDQYDIASAPVSLSFHLREFIAATGLAENLSLQLNLTFTEAAAPLCITIESDYYDCLFVLATRQSPTSGNEPEAAATTGKKRAREADDTANQKKKSMKVVAVEPRSNEQFKKPLPPRQHSVSRNAAPEASFRVPLDPPEAGWASQTAGAGSSRPQSFGRPPSATIAEQRPLFLPSSQPGTQRPPPKVETFDQLSQVEQEAIRASGLGLEDMDPDQFAAMLEDDDDFGMDLDLDLPQPPPVHRALGQRRPMETGEEDVPSAGLRAPDGFGLSEEELQELRNDPFADEAGDDDESFMPLSQISGPKHFEALDFGDD